MPRVVNLALALFFLAFLIPLWLHIGSLALSVQILLVIIAVPLSLGSLLLLLSAARPGSVVKLLKGMRPTH